MTFGEKLLLQERFTAKAKTGNTLSGVAVRVGPKRDSPVIPAFRGEKVQEWGEVNELKRQMKN